MMVPNSADIGDRGRDVQTEEPITADALATRLGDIARELQHEENPDTVLAGIVHAALELVPHVAAASVSLVTGRRTIDSRAASSDLPRRVDALQSETGQGPCLDASYEELIVRVPDLSSDQRWPDFSRAAFKLGARSMLSFQLFVDGAHLGALNLFGSEAGAFDAESERIGALVAAHAAVAVAGSKQVSQLTQALDTRDLIGQAKGILMERFKITAQEAFLLLSRASSELNIKLHDVAEQLTLSGEMTKKR
ncbi:GAF and ANTAR domain-containing protein [Arthrobacter sp. AL12]|uniref:GAF and ANTAR domain-containing protein n=1 Tax=Arthrobacter sp. AL12 TaxID=3042241 RepID=UPI00249A7E02|nr:GAF and ANTAR domain-containing protein [Arthrobacter sp. AL12]MDI3213204.1 GAF and ANTAR domain-containing protein [Arthrobacter sp. AL12]